MEIRPGATKYGRGPRWLGTTSVLVCSWHVVRGAIVTSPAARDREHETRARAGPERGAVAV